MTFTMVAISNLKRNPVRSVLTGMSLLVAAATLTAVMALDRGYSRAVRDELVHKTGVHMYITKEGCPIEAASVIAQGGLSPLFVAQDMVKVIEQFPQVDAVLPFKLFAVTTEDGSRTDIFMGVTDQVARIKPDWRYASGTWFTSDSSVVLGAEIARIEQTAVGERIYSEHFNREFVVSGILARNYSQDDGTIFLPLLTAQKLVDREGKLSAIAVKLKDVAQLDQTRTQMRASLPDDYYVLGSKELGEGILQFYGSTRVIMIVMVIVAFVVSVFGIINTMLMAVMERRREIAYLKCVGAGTGDLLRLISIEALVISAAGSLAGVILGVALSPAFGSVMRGFLVAYVPSGPVAQSDPLTVLGAFVLCTALGLACALYPAWRAARIVPMEVLRND